MSGNLRVGVIGAGNLGTALVEGLLRSPAFAKTPHNIFVTRRKVEKLESLKVKGASVSDSNFEALNNAEDILLCVEPRQAIPLLKSLAPFLTERHTLISCVSSLNIDSITEACGLPRERIVRAMPNTAVAVNAGLTCITKAPPDSNAEAVFGSVGHVLRLEEDHMGRATVLGACGIAFAMRYVRAATQAGIQLGFQSDVSQEIVQHTLFGATSLLLSKPDSHPESEIDRVTTPAGCTITGLNEMEHRGFSSAIIKGLERSFSKIDELKDM